MALLLEIVTPDRKVYSDQIDSVVIPTTSGEIGVLPGHIPLLTQLAPGELVVTKGGKPENLAIDKGFAEILGDKISVLTEAAIDVADIDLNAVEKAQSRAEKALTEAKESGQDPAEIENLERIVRFSLAQKLAKNKRR